MLQLTNLSFVEAEDITQVSFHPTTQSVVARPQGIGHAMDDQSRNGNLAKHWHFEDQ